MAADGLSKIKVKVGEHEFEFEGDAEAVKGLYTAFLDAIKDSPSAAPAAPPAPLALPPPVQQHEQRSLAGNPGSPPPTESGDLQLKRVFAEKDGVISLLALPRTESPESDGLLMLLYGYQELKPGEYPVTGVRLMQAAKQSGLTQIDRIDRTIGASSTYVLTAGSRRGKRYQLNNQGVLKARQIIHGLFG